MYEFDSVKGEGVLADQKKLSTSSLSKVILLQTDRRRDRPTDATKHYHAASWVVNIRDVVFVSIAKRLNETTQTFSKCLNETR